MAAAQKGYNSYSNGNRLRRLKRKVVGVGEAGGSGGGSGGAGPEAGGYSLLSSASRLSAAAVNNRYSQYVLSTLLRRKPAQRAAVERRAGERVPGSPGRVHAKHGHLHKQDAEVGDLNSMYSDSNTLVNSAQHNAYASSSSAASSVIFEDELTLLDSPPATIEEVAEVALPTASADVKNSIKTFNHSTARELGKSQHLHYYQLPFAWRENPFIINGYRFYSSHKRSFLSIVNWYGWHNETSNIWTHLLGGLYLIFLAMVDYPKSAIWNSDQVPFPAKLIVFVFLLAGMKCLFASMFWHTFNGTSILNLRSRFACVDYSGITLLITASIMTTEFVTMYDYKFSLYLYMSISSVLGLFGVFMNWSPKFDRPEARPLRIKFFILLALMGCLSFLHLTLRTSWKFSASLVVPVTKKSLGWYLIGVFFYGSFIPERFRTDYIVDKSIPTETELSSDLTILTRHKHIHFRPSPTKHPKSVKCCCHAHSFKSLWWVDYFGASHTIWHFFVVLGVIGHYHAILDMFAKRWIV